MTDIILEGVRASDIACLRALDCGQQAPSREDIRRLALKGWVETVSDVSLITLTGRALLERSATH